MITPHASTHISSLPGGYPSMKPRASYNATGSGKQMPAPQCVSPSVFVGRLACPSVCVLRAFTPAKVDVYAGEWLDPTISSPCARRGPKDYRAILAEPSRNQETSTEVLRGRMLPQPHSPRGSAPPARQPSPQQPRLHVPLDTSPDNTHIAVVVKTNGHFSLF